MNNGNSTGVIPTFDVNGGNNNGWGGSMGEWIIGLVALGMLGNGGLFGGFGGGNGMYEFPWLLTGQNGINNNVNDGFDTLHLSNQIEGAARQIADMQQAFNSQTAITGAITGLASDLASCCCENRLATCQTQNIVQNEGNATRFADANNTRDIITNATANTQAILDKLCQLELDGVKAQLEAKNDLIDQLRQENLYARGQASQVQQTADIRAGQATTANLLVNELRSCPIPSQPVYGNQPIFTCQPSYGCGCNNQPIFTCQPNYGGCGCGNNAYLY